MSDSDQSPIFPNPNKPSSGSATAANMIRNKIDKLYKDEPDAKEEVQEALAPGKHSVHQQYLSGLHSDGKSAEEIKVLWHEYYVGLDDTSKHEVWREFYSHQSGQAKQTHKVNSPITQQEYKPLHDDKDTKTDSIKSKVKLPSNFGGIKLPKKKNKPSLKQEFKSIAFGLTVGATFLFIYMFTFFNQRYIIPFVQPSTISAATPIITEPGVAVADDPVVIIPKLNVQAPVVYDVQFIQPGENPDAFEERTQTALESGVVHYPTSQKPGEAGLGFNSNTVIVGHSSNNIFNSGDYKFAFMQLRDLDIGDTFMINYQGTQYVYKIYEEKIVAPTEVSVLGAASRPNSATLITCDPPGFNTNRKIIIGEQISPNPATNVAASAPQQASPLVDDVVVPGNAETLWTRLYNWVF